MNPAGPTKKNIGVLLVFLLVLLAIPVKTHAYIDPGTGSYIIQVVIAGVLGGLLTLKSHRKTLMDKVKSIFTRMPRKEKDATKD